MPTAEAGAGTFKAWDVWMYFCAIIAASWLLDIAPGPDVMPANGALTGGRDLNDLPRSICSGTEAYCADEPPSGFLDVLDEPGTGGMGSFSFFFRSRKERIC